MLIIIATTILCILCIFSGFTKGQQILPLKVVLFQDGTNNVDGVTETQMTVMKVNIENILSKEPQSELFSGFIGEKFSANVKDQDFGNTINSAIMGTMLTEEFGISKFNRAPEIFILLVDSRTNLNGKVPDIVSLKKTIVIQVGPKEQELWRSMASRSVVAFHVQGPNDIPKVIKQLAKELAIMSELVCDTIEYCMDRGHRSSLYTRCQCQSCSNLCNFKSANESDSCMDYCRYDPHFKIPQKSDKPVTTPGTDEPVTSPGTGNDAGEKTLTIVITVSIALVVAAVVAVIIYCTCIKKRKKMKQPINDVEAHQEQNDNVAVAVGMDDSHADGEAYSVNETSPMIVVPDVGQNDGTGEIVSDISGNADGINDGNGETADGTIGAGVNESGGDNSDHHACLIKGPKELGLNLNAYGCQLVHQG